jgi:hypothetical protein
MSTKGRAFAEPAVPAEAGRRLDTDAGCGAENSAAATPGCVYNNSEDGMETTAAHFAAE